MRPTKRAFVTASVKGMKLVRKRHRLLRFISVNLLDFQYRPYHVRGDWKEAPLVEVPVRLLRPSHRIQSRLRVSTFRKRHIEGARLDEFVDGILVASYAGEFWIVDGHHRVRAARDLGLLSLKVRLLSG